MKLMAQDYSVLVRWLWFKQKQFFFIHIYYVYLYLMDLCYITNLLNNTIYFNLIHTTITLTKVLYFTLLISYFCFYLYFGNE